MSAVPTFHPELTLEPTSSAVAEACQAVQAHAADARQAAIEHISQARADHAANVFERMDHKDRLYQYLGARALRQQLSPLELDALIGPDGGPQGNLPRSRSVHERVVEGKMHSRAKKERRTLAVDSNHTIYAPQKQPDLYDVVADTLAKSYDPNYVPMTQPEAEDPVRLGLGKKAIIPRIARRTAIRLNRHMNIADKDVARTRASIDPPRRESKHQRRARLDHKNAKADLVRVVEQPVASIIRDVRAARSEVTLIEMNTKLDQVQEKREVLEIASDIRRADKDTSKAARRYNRKAEKFNRNRRKYKERSDTNDRLTQEIADLRVAGGSSRKINRRQNSINLNKAKMARNARAGGRARKAAVKRQGDIQTARDKAQQVRDDYTDVQSWGSTATKAEVAAFKKGFKKPKVSTRRKIVNRVTGR